MHELDVYQRSKDLRLDHLTTVRICEKFNILLSFPHGAERKFIFEKKINIENLSAATQCRVAYIYSFSESCVMIEKNTIFLTVR